jgi:hypothetical protein
MDGQNENLEILERRHNLGTESGRRKETKIFLRKKARYKSSEMFKMT